MKRRHVIIFFTLIAGAAALPLLARADRAAELNEQGIRAYTEEHYDESIRQFTEALVERPDQTELHFNRGTALSAAGKSEEAVSELGKAADGFQDPANAAAAHFNAGNTLILMDESEAAVDSYKEALKLDQMSRDIRKNLELTLRMLQDQQQEQEQEQQSGGDQQEQDQPASDDNPGEENESPDDQNAPAESQEEDREENPPMDIEDAQRILDAMRDEEKQTFEQRRMMMQEALNPRDDW